MDVENARPLTARQQQVYDTIERYVEATGEPCRANYLARRLVMHHSSAQEYIATLFRKGWLRGPTSPAQPRRWIQAR